MKLMKRLFSLTLAAALTLTLAATVFAATGDDGFSDVAADAWYAGAVTYVREKGLMSGIGNDQFAPNTPTNLAMLVTILYQDAGQPSVTSATPEGVPAGSWYAAPAAWANERGLLQNVNAVFAGAPITREDLVTVLWRYAGSPAGDSSDFSDEADISTYAAQAVDWSRANNIVSGKPGNIFDPKGGATRAEIAMILQSFFTQQTEVPGQDEKVLAAYFAYSENIGNTSNMDVDAIASASLNAHTDNETGNLQIMAKEIQDKLGADVHQIIVSEPYNPNYETMRDRANSEIQSGARPALTAKVNNLDQYEVIYLGTPVWFGELPPAVVSFLSENDLSGHTIVPVGIHLGSGFGSIRRQIQELCPNSTVAEGFTIRASTSNSQVKTEFSQWLDAQG